MAGHIERRGENSFRLIVSSGTAPDGKRIVYKKTIKVSPAMTESKKIKEAEKALAAFITEIELGEYKKPTTLSFDDLFEKWIASHQGDKRLAPKTEARYREMYNLRIKDYFSKCKLENIDTLRKSKRKDGKEGFLSEQSVKHHYRLLSAVFSYAYRKRLIKSNPMVFTEPVDAKQKQTDCFDETQVSILIDAVEQAELKFKVITHLAIASGCRLGELVGLTWDDINLERRTINIVRTAQYISDFNKAEFLEKYSSYFEDLLNQNIVEIIESRENTIKLLDSLLDRKIIIKSPKTEKSSRTITLPDTVIQLLSQYQREQKIKQIKAANKGGKSQRHVVNPPNRANRIRHNKIGGIPHESRLSY